MKLRITILKYHSWYLCQISLQIMLLPIQIPLVIFQNCLKFHSPSGSWNYIQQFWNITCGICANWYHYKSCCYLYPFYYHTITKKESKKQNIQNQTGKVYNIIIMSHTAWIVFIKVCFGCTVISYYFFLNFNSRPVVCCQQMNMGTKINMISAPWLPNINYLCI